MCRALEWAGSGGVDWERCVAQKDSQWGWEWQDGVTLGVRGNGAERKVPMGVGSGKEGWKVGEW